MRDWGTYRKLYERLPPAFERLPFSARCFAAEIIRRCDQYGRLVEGDILSEKLLTDLMFLVRAHTDDEQFMRRALGALLADGYLVFRGGHLVVRNFVAAQRKDSASRMQEKRARDSADEMLEVRNDESGPTEPEPSGEPGVTCDARASHGVTPSRDIRAPRLVSSHLVSDPGSDPRSEEAKNKSKPVSGRARPDFVPIPIPEDWQADPEHVSVLAKKFSVSDARIAAQVPEFRWYWLRGKGAGKRKSLRGWAQTFANRIEFMAKNESLYAGAEPTLAPVAASDDAARKAREAEERVLGKRKAAT